MCDMLVLALPLPLLAGILSAVEIYTEIFGPPSALDVASEKFLCDVYYG